MIKGDFHIHSDFSPDCATPLEGLVQRCIQVGLTCIAITDHNTTRGAQEIQKIAPFTVIIGEEIKSSEGEIIGLFLHKDIPKGLSPLETIKQIREQGGLVSIPHPYDRFRRSVLREKALYEILPHVDIVEAFNSRTTLYSDIAKAQQLTTEYDVVPSAVSDAHTLIELGRTYVEFPEFDGTPAGFKAALAKGHLIKRKINPLIHITTRYTKIRKRFFSFRESFRNNLS